MVDRWLSGTRHLGNTSKDRLMLKGAYLDLLLYLFTERKPIKDALHVARILDVDPRLAKRLWIDLGHKFVHRSIGSTHGLVTEILNNSGRIKGLDASQLPQGLYNQIQRREDPDLVHEDMYIPDGQETVGREHDAIASQSEGEQNETRSRASKGCPAEAIMELYNATLVPPLREAVSLSRARRGHIKALWGNGMGDMETWQSYFAYVGDSRFLTGQVDAGRGRSGPFRADLDWLIKPSNELKIREGKYHGQ